MSLLQSVRKPTRSPGWEGWELGGVLGARAVLFRWQGVDLLAPEIRGCRQRARSPWEAGASPALRVRAAGRAFEGVKGAGVLCSGSVLEPEGDVAPPSGPSGAPARLIINSPGYVRRAVARALC